jgi:hypothetical protein
VFNISYVLFEYYAKLQQVFWKEKGPGVSKIRSRKKVKTERE